MHPGKRPFAILLGFTALLASAVALADPLSFPMPGYMEAIREWSASGRINDTFTPLAYPLFAGIGYKLANVPGLIAAQALLHVALVATGYAILRQLRVPSLWSVLGVLPLVLHPDLLTSIVKTWDVSLSTELYLLIALALIRLIEGPERTRGITQALAGVALGAGMSSRPNFLLLLPVLLWAATRGGSPPRLAMLRGPIIVSAAALASFAALGTVEHGRAFFPRNGPYNLYAGHNAFTMAALLRQENAEPSIVPAYQVAFAKDGSLPRLSRDARNYYDPALAPFYTRAAFSFAVEHLGIEAELIPVKLFTFFRPDTKVHPLWSLGGAAKALLALPVLLLAAGLLWRPREQLTTAEHALLWLDALYVLPFLLTNADPRFRTPLDALLILQFVRLLALRRRRASAPGRPA